jgi:thiamine kinase-like enzyme
VEILAHFDAALRARRSHGVPPTLDRTLREAAEALTRFGTRAPCHNDLNPGNVLETSERAYLVDWETAGEGDPFVDLAQLTVFSSLSLEGRVELLAAYLGRTPSARERAHATIARVAALGFYAAAFIAQAVLAEGGSPEDAAPKAMSEILADFAQGRASAKEVGACLYHATMREAEADAYAAALREAASSSAS